MTDDSIGIPKRIVTRFAKDPKDGFLKDVGLKLADEWDAYWAGRHIESAPPVALGQEDRDDDGLVRVRRTVPSMPSSEGRSSFPDRKAEALT